MQGRPKLEKINQRWLQIGIPELADRTPVDTIGFHWAPHTTTPVNSMDSIGLPIGFHRTPFDSIVPLETIELRTTPLESIGLYGTPLGSTGARCPGGRPQRTRTLLTYYLPMEAKSNEMTMGSMNSANVWIQA